MGCQLLGAGHPFAGYSATRSRMRCARGSPSRRDRPGAARGDRADARPQSCRAAGERGCRDRRADRSGGARRPRHTWATRESFLGAARFVDRTEEQRLLMRAAGDLMTRRTGGIWMIEGQSGIGKSRLLEELRTQVLVAGAKVVRSQADGDAAGGLEFLARAAAPAPARGSARRRRGEPRCSRSRPTPRRCSAATCRRSRPIRRRPAPRCCAQSASCSSASARRWS